MPKNYNPSGIDLLLASTLEGNQNSITEIVEEHSKTNENQNVAQIEKHVENRQENVRKKPLTVKVTPKEKKVIEKFCTDYDFTIQDLSVKAIFEYIELHKDDPIKE